MDVVAVDRLQLDLFVHRCAVVVFRQVHRRRSADRGRDLFQPRRGQLVQLDFQLRQKLRDAVLLACLQVDLQLFLDVVRRAS